MKKKIHGKKNYTIGVVSDTHGLLRPEAVDALRGSDLVIHAGDIGDSYIIDELETVAPVVAVRGNMDCEEWAYSLRKTAEVEVNDNLLYVLHDISRLDLDPVVSGIRVVISGHTHRPSVQEYRGVLYVNPGSAGPRRFNLPVSAALLHINGSSVDAQVIKL